MIRVGSGFRFAGSAAATVVVAAPGRAASSIVPTPGRAARAGLLVVVTLAVLCAGCSSPPAAGPQSSTPSATPSSTSSRASTTTRTTTTTPVDPGGQLPSDLTPNVVDDECLLTGEEFGTLVGQSSIRAENTEIAGDATRRSCFYARQDADEPAGRIDVYAPASGAPADLVARIAANSAGARTLTGVGTGAVVLAGQSGSTEFVVASTGLLAVLTVLPGGASVPPADDAWIAAGTSMVGRLPS